VHRSELIDVRQEGADAAGARREAGVAEQGIQPHEPAAGALQALRLAAQIVLALAL
jgi:hypothetical protein